MLKAGVDKRIKDRIDKLKSGIARNKFLLDISYPARQQSKDKYTVKISVKWIENFLPELLVLIKSIRPHFDKIWDQNRIVASYLLLGKAYKILESILCIAKEGYSSSIVELARSGQEAIDLVFLFSNDKSDKFLKLWFKGEIVGNSESRKIIDQSVNQMYAAFNKSLPVKKAKDDIYWVYSLYTHSGYATIIEMIDVFHEDFDFETYAGFHFIRRNFHLVFNLVVNILLGIKNTAIVCNDSEILSKVNLKLKKFQSFFASPEEIDSIYSRYK